MAKTDGFTSANTSTQVRTDKVTHINRKPTMKNINKPLSHTELDELDNFLLSDAVPEESMGVVELDGFLTAIVIGPQVVPPSEWLPQVWAETDDEEMVWKSDAQAEKFITLIMRHMNGIAGQFQQAPEDFEALTYEREIEDKTIRVIDDWCYGFMQAVAMRMDDWEPIFSTDDSVMAMSIVSMYGTEEGWKELETDPEQETKHDHAVEFLEPSIAAIYEFWLKRRTVPAVMPAKSVKIGRNEPCPCGSGQKYKKCCAKIVPIS